MKLREKELEEVFSTSVLSHKKSHPTRVKAFKRAGWGSTLARNLLLIGSTLMVSKHSRRVENPKCWSQVHNLTEGLNSVSSNPGLLNQIQFDIQATRTGTSSQVRVDALRKRSIVKSDPMRIIRKSPSVCRG